MSVSTPKFTFLQLQWLLMHSYLSDLLYALQPLIYAVNQRLQGKIERYHRTMKNVVKLDNYFCPEELIAAIEKFVQRYNNERYHESLQNLTPADVYYGRGGKILRERERIKTESISKRKANYLKLKSQSLLVY